MTNHIYGPNGHIVEAFIEYLKGMTAEQWDVAKAAADVAARGAGRRAAKDAAMGAARPTAKAAAGFAAAKDAARGAVMDAAAWDAAAWVANEIQGAEIFKRDGIPFYFLPMFGFADEQAVLKGQDK